MRNIPLVDRLSDRGIIDQWGFMVFAFGGATGILFAKATSSNPIIVAACAAIVMLAYAAVVQFAGTGRLRSDQAGDNCYYLGLIYTLTSLAYAIFTFDPADTATTIVQGFGIALATTIFGLMLRVFFNQSRVDLADTEDSARLELADAAGKLRAELNQIATSLADFSHQSVQQLGELRDAVVEAITQAHTEAANGIETIAETASNAITAQSALTNTAVKRLTTALGRTVTNLDKHAAGLESLAGSTDAISVSIAALEKGAAATERAVLSVSEPINRLGETQGEMKILATGVANAVRSASDQVESFSEQASRLNAAFVAKLNDIRAAPNKVVTDAESAIEHFVFKFTEDLRELARVHGAAAEAIAHAAAAEVNLLRQHNAGLEAELSRSRENVAKVHGALVDMTGQLVEHVRP